MLLRISGVYAREVGIWVCARREMGIWVCAREREAEGVPGSCVPGGGWGVRL